MKARCLQIMADYHIFSANMKRVLDIWRNEIVAQPHLLKTWVSTPLQSNSRSLSSSSSTRPGITFASSLLGNKPCLQNRGKERREEDGREGERERCIQSHVRIEKRNVKEVQKEVRGEK